MPRGDGTGPLGIGPNGWSRGGCIGLQGGTVLGFGRGMRRRQAVPCQQAALDIDLLEDRAELLERQAAACREMARKAKESAPKTD
jgi:hypothetical protein